MSPAKKRSGRLGLFVPLAIAGVLVAAYTAYWMVVAREIERRTPEALAGLAADPDFDWRIDYESLTVTGYPYRFAVDFAAPMAMRKADGRAWRAEAIRATILPYDLRHVVVQAKGEIIGDGGGLPELRLTHAGATAGVRLDGANTVSDFAFSADALDIDSRTGGRLRLEAPRLQIGFAPSDRRVTRVQAQADAVTGDGAIAAVLIGHERAEGLWLALEAERPDGAPQTGFALVQDLPTGRYRLLGMKATLGGSVLQVTGAGYVDAEGRMIAEAEVAASDLSFLEPLAGSGEVGDALRLAAMLGGNLTLPVAFEARRTTIFGARVGGPWRVVRPQAAEPPSGG